MIARVCTKQKCQTISQHFQCPHCDTSTVAIPTIQLGMLGLQARLSLHYIQGSHYYLQLNKPSDQVQIPIEIQDLKYDAQPHLPHIEENTGLMIMDTLKSAATLITMRYSLQWSGWVLYLIEAIQAGTDSWHYRDMLIALVSDIAAKLKKAQFQEDAP